MRIEET